MYQAIALMYALGAAFLVYEVIQAERRPPQE